jgi:hypothetical protein
MMIVIFSHELDSQFRISFCLLPDSTLSQHFELAYYYPETHIGHTPFSCVVLVRTGVDLVSDVRD